MNGPPCGPTIRALVLLLPVLAIPAISGADAVPGITDEEIVRRAYDPSFSSPPGFYRDPALGGNTTLVVVGSPGRDAVATTQSEALRRVRTEVASSNVPQLRERPDDAAETEKYFAFKVRTYWWRVHKASYFDWKESTQWLAPSFTSGLPQPVGALKQRPVGEGAAAAFAEYHQVVTGQILGGSKIVAADRTRTPDGWVVRFTEARVNAPNLSPLAYDTVDVWANRYEIDRETGVVVKSRVHVAALRGKDRPVFGPGTPVPP